MADADWAKYRQLRGKTLPPSFPFGGVLYLAEHLFKRDFYAATGLYRHSAQARLLPGQVVLKIYHTDPFLGLPLRWLGRWLCDREVGFMQRLAGVPGVPRLLGRHGESGLVREFIPGTNLREYEKTARPDANFFPRFAGVLRAIHRRGIAHNDLNKPENILVRADGSPVLIDFQIATSFRSGWPLLDWLGGKALDYFQKMDRYHMLKHKRRTRLEEMTSADQRDVDRKGVLLTLHGWLLRRPYRAVRHWVMNRFMTNSPTAPMAPGQRGRRAA